MNLLLIDNRVDNLSLIINSIKCKYIIIDYYNDNTVDILGKINNLNIKNYNSIGLIKHNDIDYKLVLNHNIDSLDQLKLFIGILTYNYNIKYFDFISCNLGNLKFIFDKLEYEFKIKIGYTNEMIGYKNWELNTYNLIDVYFTENIYNYEYTLFLNPLAIIVNSFIKEYDKMPYTTPTVTYQGFINDDSYLSLSGMLIYGGTYYNSIDVGTYTITISGLYSNNYEISYLNGTLEIIPSFLLVIGNNVFKFYDGIPFYGNEGYFYSGAEDVSNNIFGQIEYSGDSQGAIATGNYDITLNGLYSYNYSINYINALLVIYNTPFFIKVNDIIKIYDNKLFTNPTVYAYNGITDLSDSINKLDGTLSFSGSYLNALNVGEYQIEASGLTSDNYIINYFEGILYIEPAELIISADNIVKYYDNIPYTDIIISYTGFQQNDNSSNLIGTLTNYGNSYLAINVGTYSIIPGNLYSDNYSIINQLGILQIVKRPLYMKLNTYSKLYDTTSYIDKSIIDILYSISGIAIGDNIYVISYNVSFDSSNAGNRIINVYDISLGGTNLTNYYIVEPVTISGYINPVLVTPFFYNINKEYDGARNATSYLKYTLSGILTPDLVYNISLKDSITAFFETQLIGEGIPIEITNITLTGTNSDNYTIQDTYTTSGNILKSTEYIFIYNPLYISQTTDVYSGPSDEGTYDYTFIINLSSITNNNISNLFENATFKQNIENQELVDINITLLNSNTFNDWSNIFQNHNLITIAIGNSNKSFSTFSLNENTFGDRLLEVVAHKLFGHAQSRAAINNDSLFYSHDNELWDHFASSLSNYGNDIFSQYIALGRYNTFTDSNYYNNINNEQYKGSELDSYSNYVKFNFQNFSFDFPLFLSGSINTDPSLLSSEIEHLLNGPNVGGTLLNNGTYNVPILIKFI